MASILVLMLITAVVTIVGGGGMYLLYLKTRPKKVSWIAKVYQVGDGIRKLKDKDGNPILEDLKMSDLKPFSTDVLEKVEKGPGLTVYRLVKLNKPTSEVTADCVEYWGPNRKEVSVLFDGGNCTLMKKGYNRNAGEAIFTPLAFDRVNMINSQMALRKDRLRKEKDILQAITPWVIAGICMLSLLAISYVMTDGFLEMHKEQAKIEVYAADKMVEAATIYREAIANLNFNQKVNKVESFKGNDELVEAGQQLGLVRPPPSIE